MRKWSLGGFKFLPSHALVRRMSLQNAFPPGSQTGNRLRCGGSCSLRWRMWLIAFIFIRPPPPRKWFPKTEPYKQPFPTRGVWSRSVVVWETLFISKERAQLRARHGNSPVVVGFAAGWLFVSCSSAGFIWFGFRVLSAVLNMELCLRYLKTCQTWNPFLVQAIFW